MKDKSWLAAYRAIVSVLAPTDAVLAPRGDWSPFPCAVRFYDDVVAVEDATVLVLHKGRMAGMPKADLADIVARWRRVFANEVFIVFARAPSRPRLLSRLAWPSDHLRLVHHHIRSRELKVLPSTIYHVHLPKTGGTAVWKALSHNVKSKVYYGDVGTFLAYPPNPGEYDLVGLHGPPSLIEDRLRPGDLVVGLVRDPIARFVSSVLHCRRDGEDPVAFTASQRAMRTMPIADFLQTDAGRYEVRLQSLLLGATRAPSPGPEPDETILARATAFVARDDTLFAPLEEAEAFVQAVLARFGIAPPPLRRLNQNRPEDYARHDEDIRAALPLLEALTIHERRLFETVVDGFNTLKGSLSSS